MLDAKILEGYLADLNSLLKAQAELRINMIKLLYNTKIIKEKANG